MDTNSDNSGVIKTVGSNSGLPEIPSAKKLTPLELNNIKLDVKHTILTPDYLQNLISQDPKIPQNPS